MKFWNRLIPNKDDMPEKEDLLVVEISSEDTKKVAHLYAKANQKQMQLGHLVLEFEEKKKQLLAEMGELKESITHEVDSLRDKYCIPEEDEYTLNLPKGSKKAVFTKGKS